MSVAAHVSPARGSPAGTCWSVGSGARACLRQTFMVVLINIPTISFGLAMGWVSVVSGESPGDSDSDSDVGDVQAVAAAAITFSASLVGVPLSASLIAFGRKPAVIVTSLMFLACWSLKLCGGAWRVAAARVCAGLGGAAAWTVAPLLAREMCSERVGGAAVAALVLANNLGVLLMYLAAYLRVNHTTVLWSCWVLSAAHCALFTLVPESPQFLTAQGRTQKARESLAWLRGLHRDDPELKEELTNFPTEGKPVSALRLVRNLFQDAGRRRAFTLCCVMVVGQETCGVLTLMQFAERVFVLARDGASGDALGQGQAGPVGQGEQGQRGSPAELAVWLGVAQLVASALGLYLVESVGRKRLMVLGALVTGASLGVAGVALGAGARAPWAAPALAAAVFADSAGLQPAPYAMMADMFDYEYRGCAVMLVSALACVGNVVELVVFAAVVARCGLACALGLAGTLTLALALYAQRRVPETRARSLSHIYDEILVRARERDDTTRTCTCPHTVVTKL